MPDFAHDVLRGGPNSISYFSLVNMPALGATLHLIYIYLRLLVYHFEKLVSVTTTIITIGGDILWQRDA